MAYGMYRCPPVSTHKLREIWNIHLKFNADLYNTYPTNLCRVTFRSARDRVYICTFCGGENTSPYKGYLPDLGYIVKLVLCKSSSHGRVNNRPGILKTHITPLAREFKMQMVCFIKRTPVFDIYEFTANQMG